MLGPELVRTLTREMFLETVKSEYEENKPKNIDRLILEIQDQIAKAANLGHSEIDVDMTQYHYTIREAVVQEIEKMGFTVTQSKYPPNHMFRPPWMFKSYTISGWVPKDV